LLTDYSLQFTRNVYQDVYPSIDPSRPELLLTGKVVIITGASRGIGAMGIAPAFAKAGPKAIVLVATNAEKLAAVETSISKINPAVQTLSVAADISDTVSVAKLFAKVKQTFGHADILINNAALASGGGTIHEEDPDKWWRNFEVNTKGAFLVSKGFISALPDPSSSPATIVNLGTAAAWTVLPFMSGYSISKLAGMQLVSHLAAAYPNITVVGVHPGLVETDSLMHEFKGFNLDSPGLTGGLAVWLSGDQAKFLSGRTIASNWSVDDLVERKDEIVDGDKLRMQFVPKLGKDQLA
jgi:NAD(P)-dependent dehydrogenase (short-subunit alcohol dehydrogenase family)